MAHLLLVEDDLLVAGLKKRQLERYGYALTHLPTGEESVAYVLESAGPVDLILMDIDLGPGIDGTVAAEQILAARDIPIVFFSSHEEPEIVQKTEAITSYGYVVKSSSITVLDASIKMAFKLYNAKQRELQKEADLQERVKEIRCLQQVGDLLRENDSLPHILSALPEMLRQAMRDPEGSAIHVRFGDAVYQTEGYSDNGEAFSVPVSVDGIERGVVRAVYTGDHCLAEKSAFLNEEKALFRSIADRIGHTVERLSSREDYAYLLQMLNEAVIFADAEGVIRRANGVAAELTGFGTPGQLTGLPMTVLYADPAVRPEMIEKLKRNNGVLNNYEIVLKRRDGSTVPTLCNIKLLQDNDGKVLGTLGAIRDVSKIRKVQQELFLKDRAMDSSINAVALADLKGRLTYVNRAFLELWGYPDKQALIGNDVSEFWHTRESADAVVKALQTDGGWKGEMVAVTRDGREFPVGVAASMVFDEDDAPVSMFAAFEDLRERKSAEAALRESEEKYRRLYDNLPFLLIEVDADTYEIVSCNPEMAERLHATPQEIEGRSLRDFLQDETMAQREQTGLKALAENRVLVVEDERNGRFYRNIYIPVVLPQRRLVQSISIDDTDLRIAQKELRENLDLLHNITGHMSDMVSLTDMNGIVLYASPSHGRLLGFPPEQLTGKSVLGFVHPEDREQTVAAIAGMVENGGAAVHEVRFQTAAGLYLWIEVIGRVQRDGKGEPVGMVFSSRDVSAAREVRRSLQRALTDLELAQQIAGLGSWNLDPAVGIPEWSAEVYRIYERDPSLGPYPVEKYSELYHGEWFELFKNSLRAAVHDGIPYDIELLLNAPSGKTKWVHAICHPEKERGPHGHCLRGTIQDITRQKTTEQALRESEFRFKALHNASFGGIAIHDKGVILDCNHGLSEVSGFAYEELIGMDGLLLIAPDWRDYVMEKIRTGYEEAYEAEGIRAEGGLYPLRLHAKNIPYKGRPVRVVEFRDITDIKQTQSALQRALQEKQMLLQELNHRIKNSLAMIVNLVQINLDRMEKDTDRNILREISLRIMTVARIYSLLYGESYDASSDLQLYFQEIVSSVQSGFPDAGDKISVSVDCERIEADLRTVSTLGLLLNEMLTNAFKYAFPDDRTGTISVRCFADAGGFVFQVSDDGVGLPEGFDLVKSTGLGMLIIQAMVEQIHGSLEAVSASGSGFTVRVPRVQPG